MWYAQVSDRGGGIPRSQTDQLFNYMYSTAPQPPKSDTHTVPLAGEYQKVCSTIIIKIDISTFNCGSLPFHSIFPNYCSIVLQSISLPFMSFFAWFFQWPFSFLWHSVMAAIIWTLGPSRPVIGIPFTFKVMWSIPTTCYVHLPKYAHIRRWLDSRRLGFVFCVLSLRYVPFSR